MRTSYRDKSRERFEEGTHPARITLFAYFGLICHVLIFWLLSFPYIYRKNGVCEVNCTSITTGWDAGFLILPFFILPLFSYLACLLPMLRKRAQREEWLERILYLNVLVNLVGFLLFYMLLWLAGAADIYEVTRRDAAYGIHLALLLLAVVSSSVISLMLGFWLRRSRKLRL